MIGFAFRRQHCYTEHGIVMNSKSRPILPSKRRRQVEIPLRNGRYEFEDETYDVRIIEVTCFIDTATIPNLRQKIREIAAWLSKKGTLIFDDEPELSYTASVFSIVPLEQIITAGIFTLIFECYPMAQGRTITEAYTVTQSPQELRTEYRGTAPAKCRLILANTGSSPISNIKLLIGKED